MPLIQRSPVVFFESCCVLDFPSNNASETSLLQNSFQVKLSCGKKSEISETPVKNFKSDPGKSACPFQVCARNSLLPTMRKNYCFLLSFHEEYSIFKC